MLTAHNSRSNALIYRQVQINVVSAMYTYYSYGINRPLNYASVAFFLAPVQKLYRNEIAAMFLVLRRLVDRI